MTIRYSVGGGPANLLLSRSAFHTPLRLGACADRRMAPKRRKLSLNSIAMTRKFDRSHLRCQRVRRGSLRVRGDRTKHASEERATLETPISKGGQQIWRLRNGWFRVFSNAGLPLLAKAVRLSIGAW